MQVSCDAAEQASNGPIVGLQRWDEFLVERYPTGPKGSLGEGSPSLPAAGLSRRNYRADAQPCIKELYRLNHAKQTLDFVRSRHRRYVERSRCRTGVWQVLRDLSALRDSSHPDSNLTELDHALTTAEAIRRDGQPQWLVLTGLIHDLGKLLSVWGEPQWAVVGDTFPVGCGYSDKVVFPEFFIENPDFEIPAYQSDCGIYSEHCGLDKVNMSWGHDEYLYSVMKSYLPPEALYVIRYHSFYAAHREGAYRHLMSQHDLAMLPWVRTFNNYDLYSGDAKPVDLNTLRPFYEDLVSRYIPGEIAW